MRRPRLTRCPRQSKNGIAGRKSPRLFYHGSLQFSAKLTNNQTYRTSNSSIKWTNQDLKAIMQKTSNGTAATPSNPSSTSSPSSSSNTSAIVGGVIGGLAFLLIIAAVTWFLIRRQHRRRGISQQGPQELQSTGQDDKKTWVGKPVQEMYSNHGYQEMSGSSQLRGELSAEGERGRLMGELSAEEGGRLIGRAGAVELGS